MQIVPEIDPSGEDAIFRVVDLAKQLVRKTIELEERIAEMEGFVNE